MKKTNIKSACINTTEQLKTHQTDSSSLTLKMKAGKRCLENKCQDIFSARMLSHEPEESLTAPLQLVTWTLSTRCSIQTGGRRNYFDPLWVFLYCWKPDRVYGGRGDACASHLWLDLGKGGTLNLKMTAVHQVWKVKYCSNIRTPQRKQTKQDPSHPQWWKITLYYTNMTKCRDTGL